MKDVSFEDFKSVGDDEMGLAFPFGAVSGAAPAVGVASGFQMLVEGKVVQTKIDPAAWTKVEFHC